MSLWERILGETHDGPEETEPEELDRVHVVEAAGEGRQNRPEDRATTTFPERSPRQVLMDFVMEMRQRERASHSSAAAATAATTSESPLSSWRSPFADTAGGGTTPPSDAETSREDLRVPIRAGDAEMVHLAQ